MAIAGMAAFFSACDDDDDNSSDDNANLITEDETWSADEIHVLDGRVIVDAGVTLTIEPGTIIKGESGDGALASCLIISRGAKINAQGTAANPIIFTSSSDDIAVGETAGSNLDENDNNKWGGLIILGNAPISAKDGDTESSIEGLPADEDYAKYGGTASADNSGILSYVSIRHGGTEIGDGNEINGLTLGGVGSGTTISNIEIFATLDDGVEFFGGTVNVTNVLVFWQGDDGLDIDQNYSGTVTNFMVYHGDGSEATDEGLEIDGPEGTTNVSGLFTLADGTLYSDGVENASAADIKDGAQGTLSNVLWVGYNDGATIKIEGEYDEGDCSSHTDKTYTDALTNVMNDTFVVTGSTFDAVKVYSKKNDDDEPYCSSIPDSDEEAAEAKIVSAGTATGADASVFSWTMAVSAGYTAAFD